MRIGIDARFYGPEYGKGIGRYTQKLIKNLEKIDQRNQYFIFLRKENFNNYQPQNENFHKVLADYQWYSLNEQIFFPWQLYKFKLDLVHFLHFNVPLFYFKPFVVTIHDLIHEQSSSQSSNLPSFLFFLKKRVYSLVIKNAIQRSRKIITISYFSQKEIIKKYNVDQNKIIVIYEAS
jgi:glycosyltransferase involved in cell wall biosynthesis